MGLPDPLPPHPNIVLRKRSWLVAVEALEALNTTAAERVAAAISAKLQEMSVWFDTPLDEL